MEFRLGEVKLTQNVATSVTPANWLELVLRAQESSANIHFANDGHAHHPTANIYSTHLPISASNNSSNTTNPSCTTASNIPKNPHSILPKGTFSLASP
jgi:hypothetical protein